MSVDDAQPVQPEFDELSFLRQMLAGERRRNGQVERVLTNHITSLERQIETMKDYFMSTIQVPVGPKL
jgi:hypothetical protein